MSSKAQNMTLPTPRTTLVGELRKNNPDCELIFLWKMKRRRKRACKLKRKSRSAVNLVFGALEIDLWRW